MIKTQLGSNQRTYTEEARFSGYIKNVIYCLHHCKFGILVLCQSLKEYTK